MFRRVKDHYSLLHLSPRLKRTRLKKTRAGGVCPNPEDLIAKPCIDLAASTLFVTTASTETLTGAILDVSCFLPSLFGQVRGRNKSYTQNRTVKQKETHSGISLHEQSRNPSVNVHMRTHVTQSNACIVYRRDARTDIDH